MKEVNVNKKLEKLISSGNKAFDLLLEEVEKPIDPDLQDDKSRNAMKAKKECFMDAQDILLAINKIQNRIEEGVTSEDQETLE